MHIKNLLKEAKTSEKRWNGNTFNCNRGNNFDKFCFDTISSTHQSMPELILKTEFQKSSILAYLCFNNKNAKNGHILLASHIDILNRTIENLNFTKVFKISFEKPNEDEIFWDELKAEITTNKLVVDICDIRKFNPVGLYKPKAKPKKTKAKSK